MDKKKTQDVTLNQVNEQKNDWIQDIDENQEQEKLSLKRITNSIYVIGLGSVSFGYSWTLYNQIFEQVKTRNKILDSQIVWIQGSVNSIFILFAIFGCMTLSLFRTFSRIKTCILADIIFFIGSTLLFSNSTLLLLIGRSIQGYIAGINSVLVPLYLKEITPLKNFSQVSVMIPIAIVCGQVMAFVIGAPIDMINNKFYLFVCLAPCLIIPVARIGLILYFQLPDTTRYYLEKKDELMAKKAICHSYPESKVDEIYENELEKWNNSKEENKMSVYSLMKQNPQYKLVFIGVWLFFVQQFAGINAINFYSTQVFKDLGTEAMAQILTGIWGIIDLSLLFISQKYIVEKFSRKKLLVGGSLLTGLILMICGILSQNHQKLLSIAALFTYIGIFNFSLSPTVWAVVSEIMDVRLLNIGVASHWVNALFIAQFFPIFIQIEFIRLPGSFYILGTITLLNAAILYFVYKETKGLTKKQIIDLYKRNKA